MNASQISVRPKRDFVATLPQSEQIASEILAEAFSTLRIRLLKPAAIAELRAEVKRRVALNWQRAA